MPKARINGIEICYRQAGHGHDVLLIHGLAANHAFWNLELLLPLARTYGVTAFDLRGHGYSNAPSSGYTSADMAADVLALMDHLAIQRAHLVGHSFGGLVAAQCALQHPDRVFSLTLADTRFKAIQPSQRLKDWPDWRQAKAQLEDYGISIDENEDEVGLRLLELMADPKRRETRKRLSQRALFVPFGGWSNGNRSADRWLRLLATTSARQDFQAMAGLTLDRLRRLPHPTLAIYGQRSRCMMTCRKLQSLLPDCRVVVVPDAGHFHPLSKPGFLAETLLGFFADNEAPQPRKHVHDGAVDTK